MVQNKRGVKGEKRGAFALILKDIWAGKVENFHSKLTDINATFCNKSHQKRSPTW